MKSIKYAISYVIYNEDRSKILIVQRPSNDEDLPNMWGLPAGTIKDNETNQDAIIRSGRDKLGVELEVVRFIDKDDLEREKYILHMEDYEAKIISGKPEAPQKIEGITQYSAWRWGVPDDLKKIAGKGSLCTQIYLKSINNEW